MSVDLNGAEFAYLPNGGINVPYILANANLLLREGDLALAASLFRLCKNHPKLGHCAHFGLGQCYLAAKDFGLAAAAFEKALSLSRKPYIALALLNALSECKEFDQLEKMSLKFAQEFSQDSIALDEFKKIYRLEIQRKHHLVRP